MRRIQALAILLIPLSMMGAGCGQSLSERATEYAIEKAIENESGGSIDLDLKDGGVAYTDNEGNKVQYGQNISLPADFPKDLPVYKGAAILTTATTADGSYLSMQSSDSAATVLAWYEQELAGWTKDESIDTGGLSARTFSKGTQKITITVMSSDGQTIINANLSEAK